MSTTTRDAPSENSKPAANPAPLVVQPPPLSEAGDLRPMRTALPASIISLVMHALIIGLFMLVSYNAAPADSKRDVAIIQTQVDKDESEKANLENEDIGNDPSQLLNYNINRIEDVSVPGPVNPNEAVGIKDAPEAAPVNVPPPPGFGDNRGQGGHLESLTPGKGSLVGFAGGMGGTFVPGGFGGRSGSTREQMVKEGGGNGASEAAVARGQRWLVEHQAPDGHWSLDGFNTHGRCRCSGGGQNDDIAATAFGLLPLLGAGETHKDAKCRYGKNVGLALDYLIRKQNKEGYFGGTMYSHGLATIAICEAYGMTQDPRLKGPAQRALNYIRAAQSESGGWRYEPRQGGDTSVLGWQVMALKSGQMSGLEVDDPKNPTLGKASKWLNTVQTADGGGYGYTSPQETPTMTAVGLLCRQYLGWGPRNPGLVGGVGRLKQTPPGALKSIYYEDYATQVMHHVGGEAWESWNPRMRDKLIKEQDQGESIPHQRGSWSPKGDAHGGAGGRIMQTSLSLLSLEVYYRHLPLYRRDAGGMKAAAN
jgi:hypothetical protein